MLAAVHHASAGFGLAARAVGRLKERYYLEAAMATCALAAMADGEVALEPRYAIDAALRRDPLLALFPATQAAALLDDRLHRLRHDPVPTRAALGRRIARAARHPERALALARLAWQVLTARDRLRSHDLAELESLCYLLGVDVETVRRSALAV